MREAILTLLLRLELLMAEDFMRVEALHFGLKEMPLLNFK
jgi:hypothetical protein